MPTTSGESNDIQRARELVENAEQICILTGAGVSAESGVPTFRGEDGLWRSNRPEELATPQAFRRDPRLVWEWYEWRRGKIRECKPNPGHEALARLSLRSGARLVTQNVDGLHELAARRAAGAEDPSPAMPLELHGSIFRVRCTACTYRVAHREPIPSESLDDLPQCPVCSSLLRPDVVWFGEALDSHILNEAFTVAGKSDLCLVVGTSALVHPAASVPLATLHAGGRILEVNPTDTPLTSAATVSLQGPSGALLPQIIVG
ncbi:NAD-dependent deacetylase [Gemmatimonadota bacterium]